jgi:hypothetical protein
MKISVEELRAAFDVVNAVDDDAAVESSHFIRLQQNQKQISLTLTGTLWGEASADGDGNGKWTAYVDRRVMKAFLATANGKEIEILYKDKLILKANSRIELALHTPITGYESWKPAATYDLSDELKAIINTGAKYLPSSAGTENVSAICFRKDYGVIATDTLFLFGVLSVKLPADVLIPPAIAKLAGDTSGKLATDNDGAGIALPNGFVYEPRSTKLSKYPFDGCKNRIDEAAKTAPLIATASVKDTNTVFKDAQMFLLDKAEAGVVEAREKGIQLTITLGTGTFRRTIPATLKGKLETKIAVKKFLPWLDLVSKVKEDAVIEVAKVQGALVMRFLHGKVHYVFLAADL